MKRLLLLSLLIICLCLASCGRQNDAEQEQAVLQESEPSVSAVWVSCYELSNMLYEGSQEAFERNVRETINKCADYAINTVFLHVRPFCDAMYPSAIYGWSEFALDKNGNPPDYDPLEIFLSVAHENKIQVHAWINPYRVSYDEDFIPDEKFADFSVSCSEGVYLDPSSPESHKAVLDGVREIISRYSVDGIHIDDYFYPVKDKGFDSEQYGQYRQAGGRLNLASWRRSNVNALVSSLYSLVHSSGKELIFSISPAADIDKNRRDLYADVTLWLEVEGFADWLVPQIYFGFEHEKMPFEKTASAWERLAEGSGVKLICGLAPYKIKTEDTAAGRGKNEWLEADDIIGRQVAYVQDSSVWSGYSLFSFSALKNMEPGLS